MTAVDAYLSGAIGMASVVIALFFARFWRTTGDRFFLYFACSFLLQAAGRLFFEQATPHTDNIPVHYLLRLIAYSLILIAIVDKNRRPGPDKS